jgi:hypothetical protein
MLQALGKVEEAASELRAAVVGMERLHGPDHPDVLEYRTSLAATFFNAGRQAQAEVECRLVVAGYERLYGTADPRTAKARENLRMVRAARG